MTAFFDHMSWPWWSDAPILFAVSRTGSWERLNVVRWTMKLMNLLGMDRVISGLTLIIFIALPIAGLVAGPSFAALILGLGVAQGARALVARRVPSRIDCALLALAVGFAGLCWASVLWSIAPEQSSRGALQVTFIFAAAILVLSGHLPPERVGETLCRFMPVSFAVGAAIIFTDAMTGFHLQTILAGGNGVVPTKYNRGADYLVLVGWPLLARAWYRREWVAVLLLVTSVAVMLVYGLSATGSAAAVVGAVALALSSIAPRIAAHGLAAASGIIAVFTPLVLRILAENRAFIASHLLGSYHLVLSGLHRLEIWDYMTARVLEHPVLGWGLWSAKLVPIHPDELSHYIHADAEGTYPHNQWLQLWLETGMAGAAIALALVLAVLVRTRRAQPRAFEPFAHATVASALTISFVNFEITTDSWWAALVASAYLFQAFGFQAQQNRDSAPKCGPT